MPFDVLKSDMVKITILSNRKGSQTFHFSKDIDDSILQTIFCIYCQANQMPTT